MTAEHWRAASWIDLPDLSAFAAIDQPHQVELAEMIDTTRPDLARLLRTSFKAETGWRVDALEPALSLAAELRAIGLLEAMGSDPKLRRCRAQGFHLTALGLMVKRALERRNER